MADLTPEQIAVVEAIEAKGPAITTLLPSHLTHRRFQAMLLREVGKNPKVMQCHPPTILQCALEAAQMGFEFSGTMAHAYILPFWNSKLNRYDAQLIPGYRGLMKLMRQGNPEIEQVQSAVVFEDDEFTADELTISHKYDPMKRDNERGKATGVYAIVKYRSGGTQHECMNLDDVMRVRAMSKQPDGDLWATHWKSAWRKTALRRLCKYLELSSEVMDKLDEFDAAEFRGEAGSGSGRGVSAVREELERGSNNADRSGAAVVDSDSDSGDAGDTESAAPVEEAPASQEGST